MVEFRTEIDGQIFELRTTDDLANVERVVEFPETSCVQTAEGIAKLRDLLAAYEASGRPELEVIDATRRQIDDMLTGVSPLLIEIPLVGASDCFEPQMSCVGDSRGYPSMLNVQEFLGTAYPRSFKY